MHQEPRDVLVVYVPRESTEAVLAAIFDAGAGRVGDYEHCAFVAEGRGQFRPVQDARPVLGRLGELERVAEHRVEVVLPRRLRTAVVAAVRSAHPYEEPVFHIIATAQVEETLAERDAHS